LFGIGLGITNLAIYGAEQRGKKVMADKMQESISDKYEKDAIDDSYHSENKSHSRGDSK